MNPIFLSASIQPPGIYTPSEAEPGTGSYDTDRFAIRECTLQLLGEVLRKPEAPERKESNPKPEAFDQRAVCFGGHPRISPFVLHAAESLGSIEQVEIYQAGYFEPDMPEDHKRFQNFIWGDSRRWTKEARDRLSEPERKAARDESLAAMRSKMLGRWQCYCAGFFLGGKDGVEDEWDVFVREHPQALLFPVGSTGGAARYLWETKEHACLKSWQRSPLFHNRAEDLYASLGRNRSYRGVILAAFDLINSSEFSAGRAKESC
ncbi:MAG TPA: hypothetical protein VG796_25780 [Verrucomicrobiales bacterium]|nr:hypothetical protein [Verrucomicrobiales bacterium]